MQCLSPVDIPVYVVENGCKVKHYIQVPCGHCAACLARRQSQWSFRIEQEVLDPATVSALFVTLTYAPAYLPADCSVHKEDVQKYLKRLRTNLERRYHEKSPSLRYFFCGEYGTRYGRPHYHAILCFTRSVDYREIVAAWQPRGIVDVAEFTPARGGYVAKYSVKQLGDDGYAGRTAPFMLCSKGLGSCFLRNRSAKSLRYSSVFYNLSGRPVKLPRYYIDKLYPKWNREKYTFTDSRSGYEFTMYRRSRSSVPGYSLYRWNADRQFALYYDAQVRKHERGEIGYLNSLTDRSINYARNIRKYNYEQTLKKNWL